MRPTAVISLVILLLLSCRGPSEPVPLWAPGFETPIIPGIYRTDADGNILQEYGAPHIPEDPAGLLEVYPVYPNPFNRHASGRFYISPSILKARVKVWIVRGISVMEGAYHAEITQANDRVAATPGGVACQILIDDRYTFDPELPDTGVKWYFNYTIYMDESYPDGYYRCYFQVNDILSWTDFLLLNDVSCNNLLRLGLELPDRCD